MKDLNVNILCNSQEEQDKFEQELREKYHVLIINYMPWNRWDLRAYGIKSIVYTTEK